MVQGMVNEKETGQERRTRSEDTVDEELARTGSGDRESILEVLWKRDCGKGI